MIYQSFDITIGSEHTFLTKLYKYFQKGSTRGKFNPLERQATTKSRNHIKILQLTWFLRENLT